jgi:hypothetical protein
MERVLSTKQIGDKVGPKTIQHVGGIEETLKAPTRNLRPLSIQQPVTLLTELLLQLHVTQF